MVFFVSLHRYSYRGLLVFMEKGLCAFQFEARFGPMNYHFVLQALDALKKPLLMISLLGVAVLCIPVGYRFLLVNIYHTILGHRA